MTFPFEVERVAGTAALEMREEGRGYPVIAGSPKNREALREGDVSGGGADVCLEEATRLDVDAYWWD